jgi:hypothetical protein
VTASHTEDAWDAAAEEKKWRESLKQARKAQDEVAGKLSSSSSGFYLLCLAELDAGGQLLTGDCFSSRARFVAQLRRLMAEPSTPSEPVPSIQAYRDSQRWWLESLIRVYESNT